MKNKHHAMDPFLNKKANNPVSKASPSKPQTSKTPTPVKKIVPQRVYKGDLQHKDNSFREFRRLIALIAETPSYLNKTELVRNFFNKGMVYMEKFVFCE